MILTLSRHSIYIDYGNYGWKGRKCETTRNDKTKWTRVRPDERGKAGNDRKNASVASFFVDRFACMFYAFAQKTNRESKRRKQTEKTREVDHAKAGKSECIGKCDKAASFLK